jgi:hypothetical protein
MAKGVHGHAAMDAQLGRRAVDGSTDGVGTQLLVGCLARKQERAVWPFEPPILAQGFEQPMRKRHQARPITLAVANMDEAGLAVDVPHLEREDLGDAQAGAVGGHDDHAVLERLELGEQGLHVVALDDGRQLLGHSGPGHVLHLGGPSERDGVEEAERGHVHLDGRGAGATLVVKHEKLHDLLAAQLGGRAHEMPHEPSSAPEVALLGARRIPAELEIGRHLLVQLTHVSSPCGCRRPVVGRR